jgi:hypothetical protein
MQPHDKVSPVSKVLPPAVAVSRRGAISRVFSLAALAALGAPLAAGGSAAQETGSTPPSRFDPSEVLATGHQFFGATTRGLASVVEEASRRWGEPNGYILGQEAGGAFIGGLRFGEGTLFTRNAGDYKIYWQGPSLGIDAGAEGSRTMMLVYRLPNVDAMLQRFGGMDGSAYLVGGLGMTALNAGEIIVVPIRTGVGARLGLNVGYLKFTAEPTWNPF